MPSPRVIRTFSILGADGAGKTALVEASNLFDDLDLPDLGDEAPAAPAAGDVKVPSSIFRAYDIRGVVGSTLNPGVARQIGSAAWLTPGEYSELRSLAPSELTRTKISVTSSYPMELSSTSIR